MSDLHFSLTLDLEYFNMDISIPREGNYLKLLYMISRSLSDSIGATPEEVAATLIINSGSGIIAQEDLNNPIINEKITIMSSNSVIYGTLGLFNAVGEIDEMTFGLLDERIRWMFEIATENRDQIADMLEISSPIDRSSLLMFIADSIILGQNGSGSISIINSLREQLANITLIDEIRVNHLTEAAFEAIPTIKFDSTADNSNLNENCTICYCEFEDEEELKVLKCSHVFHTECLKPWLTSNNTTCPICREAVTSNSSDLGTSTREVENVVPLD